MYFNINSLPIVLSSFSQRETVMLSLFPSNSITIQLSMKLFWEMAIECFKR